MKELITSKSRHQCPRYSGILIYTLLALANLSKTSEIKDLIVCETRDQCPGYSETYI